MAIADPIKTVKVYLAADSSVYTVTRRNDLAQVYAGEVLRDLVPVGQLPHPCVVLHGSGGPQSRGYLPVSDQRVDVHCYGGSPEEAMRVFLAVEEAFARLVDGPAVRTGGVGLLQTASLSGGVIQRREPDTKWPLAWRGMAKRTTEEMVDVRYDGPDDRLVFNGWEWARGATATCDGEPVQIPARMFRELLRASRGTALFEIVSGDPMADPDPEPEPEPDEGTTDGASETIPGEPDE